MLEVQSHNYMVPTQTPRGWRVGAEAGIEARWRNKRRSKLINGTIDLKAGDAVQVHLVHAGNADMTVEWTPRTPDGRTVQMLGKFLPANGYEMGELYYFKIWSFATE